MVRHRRLSRQIDSARAAGGNIPGAGRTGRGRAPRPSPPALLAGSDAMRTAVPGLCGTVIVLRTFIASVRSFAGFSAVLLVMFMRTVGTSTTVADVGTGLARMVTPNIPQDNPTARRSPSRPATTRARAPP
jgi:hypothetical protein